MQSYPRVSRVILVSFL
uniref:Uncharacterized protein n=1 Tax=Arundo donax TaxID=35708 RepID=A0A0A9G714_ARUDO